MPFEMSWFNVSASLNVFRVLAKPSLMLPQATVSNFNELPIPLNEAFAKYGQGEKEVNIKAVVLDKDDCFAVPHENQVHKLYQVGWYLHLKGVTWQYKLTQSQEHFQRLRQQYPGSRLLIVSNTAGASAVDPSREQAELLGANTGVHVLQHSTKKPGCGPEILKYLRSQKETEGILETEIAVVGDRLMTDMLLANMMGSYGLWIKDGVVSRENKSIFTKLEQKVASFLLRRGYEAFNPNSPFEE